MKIILTSLLLWSVILLPGWAMGAEEGGYRLIAFDGDLKKSIQDEGSWKACGDYVAATDTTEGRLLYFNFERIREGVIVNTYVFILSEEVSISISERAKTPMVIMEGEGSHAQFALRMNPADHRIALPCLGKGTGV